MAIKKKVPSKTSDAGFQQTVDRINAQDMAKPNDMPVGEDGVIYDEPLIAGYRDDEGITHSTFAYREMDGSDEEEINKPDIRSNPGKVVTTLCERCVLKIGDIDKKSVDRKTWGNTIRRLYLYDLEYMMFKIRELSKGGTVKFKQKCPHCGGTVETDVDFDEFDVIPFSGNHELRFNLRRGVKDHHGNYHKEGSVRIMNGFDSEIILPQYRKNEAVGKTLMLSRLMQMDDDGEGFMLDTRMVQKMSSYDRDLVEQLVHDNTFGIDMSTDMICPNCGESFTLQAGSSDFF